MSRTSKIRRQDIIKSDPNEFSITDTGKSGTLQAINKVVQKYQIDSILKLNDIDSLKNTSSIYLARPDSDESEFHIFWEKVSKSDHILDDFKFPNSYDTIFGDIENNINFKEDTVEAEMISATFGFSVKNG